MKGLDNKCWEVNKSTIFKTLVQFAFFDFSARKHYQIMVHVHVEAEN